jgi:hypothetical protein
MKLGAVHRSPGFCLMAEENLKKHQLGDHQMKAMQAAITIKWDPSPQNYVRTITQHIKVG